MKKKNVIWILGDQHRAQALSCNGDPNVNTPNLDRLAVEGVNFRNAVSGAPDSAFIQSVIPTKHGDSVDEAWRAVVTADGWKYVCFEGHAWLMYNLNEDPYEQVNLAFNSVYGTKRSELNERLVKWIADTGDSFVLP